MLRAVEGVFRDGHVELREMPGDIQEARVIVTFLVDVEPPSHVPPEPRAERLRAFKELVASLPDAPALPLAAFDRENLYP